MRRALSMLLLALSTAACGRTAPVAAPVPRPAVRVEVAYVGPAQAAHAFAAGLRDGLPPGAGGLPPGAGGLPLAPVVLAATCAGRTELHAALAAGADPAVSAAAVVDCGPGGAATVAMLRQLRLPSVLWGAGLRAVTASAAGAPAAVRQAAALAAYVAAYDRRAGLDPIACRDSASFCAALAADGLRVVAAPDLRHLLAAHPLAVWTGAPPARSAALRRQLTAARFLGPIEGSGLRAPGYLAAAGAAAAGTIAFTESAPAADPAQLARFHRLFGAAPAPGDLQAYAAGQVLAAAVGAAGPRRAAISARLQSGVRGLPTVAGPVTFDRQGTDVQPPRIAVATAGRHGWTPATPPGATVSASVY